MLQTTLIADNLIFSFNNRKRHVILIADDVREYMIRSITGKNKYNQILDLSGIDFIDSASLTMLLGLQSTAFNCGYCFYISNVSEQVKELISLMKLENAFNVYSFENPHPKWAA